MTYDYYYSQPRGKHFLSVPTDFSWMFVAHVWCSCLLSGVKTAGQTFFPSDLSIFFLVRLRGSCVKERLWGLTCGAAGETHDGEVVWCWRLWTKTPGSAHSHDSLQKHTEPQLVESHISHDLKFVLSS